MTETASAIVSVDGLIIVSCLPAGVEEDWVSAMSAAMLSLGERTASELRRGGLDQVYVKGKDEHTSTDMTKGAKACIICLSVGLATGGAKGLAFRQVCQRHPHIRSAV